jgi:hypothetical protein
MKSTHILEGGIEMDNNMEAYCTVCGKYTYFIYDGEDWVCQTCDSENTNAMKGETDMMFDQYKD